MNPLLHRLAVSLGDADEFLERGHFDLGHRAAIGVARQVADNLLHTGLAGIRVADQDPGAAGRFVLRFEGTLEHDAVGELVALLVVKVARSQALHKIVVDETRTEDVIAFGQQQPHLLLRIRVEKDQAGGFGLHHLAADRLSIHPEAQHHRLGGRRRAFAGQGDADGVLAIEIDAVGGFDGAGIHPPDALILIGIFHGDRFGQRVGRDRARGDPLGRRHVLLHEHGRDGQDVADVVEALAGIVGGEVFLRAELHVQQVANGVGVLSAVQAVGRDPARVGFGVAVRLVEFTLDVLDQSVDLRLRPRLAFGRHFPGTELLQNRLPAFPLIGQRRRRQERRGVKAARGQLAAVALGTRVFQNGRDGLLESRGARYRRPLRGRRQRGNGRGQDPGHGNREDPVATS